jgi:alpha-beta hydrolase superfamily lysophospholipase
MRRALILAASLAAPILLAPAAAASNSSSKSTPPEVVEIKTSDGVKLAASFYKPANRSPAVLLVHDAGGNRAQLEPMAERLVKANFGVVTIDLRGHGGSKTEKLDWEKLSDGDKKSTWSFAARDLDAAAEWVLGQENIHGTNLSIVGVGSGCALAVRHAQSDENVVCLALLAPHAQSYGFDVKKDITALAGLPTFVLASKDDEAERMAIDANTTSPNPFVEISLAKSKTTSVLEDKRLPSTVAQWLGEKAMPKKGDDGKKKKP